MRLAGANGHNEDSLPRYVAQQIREGASAVACFESQDQRRALGSIPGSRLLEPGPEFKARARSTSIVTNAARRRLGVMVRQVSEQIDAFERVAPDRVIVCEMFDHPVTNGIPKVEGIAFIGVHLDAGPEVLAAGDRDHPIVREYEEGVDSVAAAVEYAEKDNLLVVVSGDLQVAFRNSRPWSPQRKLVEPYNLHPVVRGIDWMLVDRRLEVVDSAFTEMHDHWAVSVTAQAK